MALLPQELSSPKERLGAFELPPNDAVPLVQLQWQIPMALNPFGIIRIHSSFGCWANGNRFFELRLTGSCNPGDLGRESVDVILLPLKNLLGNKHGEVSVLNPVCLDFVIEPPLDGFPDAVGPWFQDVAPTDVIVVQHIRFQQDIGVPGGEILILLRADGDLNCIISF